MKPLVFLVALFWPIAIYAADNSEGLGVTRDAIIERALKAGHLTRDDFSEAKPDQPPLTVHGSYNDGDYTISAVGDPDDIRQIQIFISTLTNSVDKSLSTAGDIVNLVVPDHPKPHPNIAREMPNASESTQWTGQKLIEAWEFWPGRGARKEWRQGNKLLIFEGTPPDYFFLTIIATADDQTAVIKPDATAPETATVAAARDGNADAQYDLAEAHYYGRGVAKNFDEAVRWYRLAAEQGHALAQKHLGMPFPHRSGIDLDPAERLRWLGSAADQGNADAYHELAKWQFRDPRDPRMAARSFIWCEIAAELGNGLGQLCLATRYRNGWGVERDDSLAYAWATIALANLEPGFAAMNASYMQADYRQSLSAAQRAEATKTAMAWAAKPFADLKPKCDSDECAIWR